MELTLKERRKLTRVTADRYRKAAKDRDTGHLRRADRVRTEIRHPSACQRGQVPHGREDKTQGRPRGRQKTGLRKRRPTATMSWTRWSPSGRRPAASAGSCLRRSYIRGHRGGTKIRRVERGPREAGEDKRRHHRPPPAQGKGQCPRQRDRGWPSPTSRPSFWSFQCASQGSGLWQIDHGQRCGQLDAKIS